MGTEPMSPEALVQAPEAPTAKSSAPRSEVILDVLSKAGAVFFRWEPFGGLSFLSASPSGLMGYSQEELLHDPDLAKRIIDPAFLDEVERRQADFYIVGEEAVRLEFPLIARSGERAWMEAAVVPELGATGVVTGFLGVAMRAPERKRPAGPADLRTPK